ncbi:MAG: hypothetical protein HN398_03025 [Thiotrichales bacterium]|jgi:hypothetical protein|nr:hypothetical protein [Thiotrichales bacterium]
MVLIEAISVVIRVDSLLKVWKDDWDAFNKIVPNRTLCSDGELVRVGFMTPDDVQKFVERYLVPHGLVYLHNDQAVDIVIVDQNEGVMKECDWVEFSYIDVDIDSEEEQPVAGCRLVGGKESKLVTPSGWEYEKSLSYSNMFLPADKISKNLKFVRTEDGEDVYLNLKTGQEIYTGRVDSDLNPDSNSD